ncbi:prolyl 4-hydroxylase subunit alpha-1-like protein, partial [Trifolium pratense]
LGSVFGVRKVKFDPTRVIQLSWSPRAFLYKNFLTDEECDHLKELPLKMSFKCEASLTLNRFCKVELDSAVRLLRHPLNSPYKLIL